VRATTDTTYGFGLSAFTATGDYLLSVIATNTTDTDAEIYVYSVPFGSSNPEEWVLVAYKLPLPAYNSYETFRFGVNDTDTVYVAGSAGVQYSVQGIEQIG
jgi:hypothetical protein